MRPPSEFILIVDHEGDVVEVLSAKSTTDEAFSLCRHYSSQGEQHIPWRFKDGKFTELRDALDNVRYMNLRVAPLISESDEKIVDDMVEAAVKKDQDYMAWKRNLKRYPDFMGGAVYYAGTAVTVPQVMRSFAAGDSKDKILADHPGLTIQDVEFTERYLAHEMRKA